MSDSPYARCPTIGKMENADKHFFLAVRAEDLWSTMRITFSAKYDFICGDILDCVQFNEDAVAEDPACALQKLNEKIRELSQRTEVLIARLLRSKRRRRERVIVDKETKGQCTDRQYAFYSLLLRCKRRVCSWLTRLKNPARAVSIDVQEHITSCTVYDTVAQMCACMHGACLRHTRHSARAQAHACRDALQALERQYVQVHNLLVEIMQSSVEHHEAYFDPLGQFEIPEPIEGRIGAKTAVESA